MNRPTKATPSGLAYLDLQNRARRDKRSTQELLTLYVLERWLARLAESRHAGEFVLEGGVLLAVFEARRPTVDADLLARNLPNDEASVVARTIRDDDLYSGVRVGMDCELSTANVKLWLDVQLRRSGHAGAPCSRVAVATARDPECAGARLSDRNGVGREVEYSDRAG